MVMSRIVQFLFWLCFSLRAVLSLRCSNVPVELTLCILYRQSLEHGDNLVEGCPCEGIRFGQNKK